MRCPRLPLVLVPLGPGDEGGEGEAGGASWMREMPREASSALCDGLPPGEVGGDLTDMRQAQLTLELAFVFVD